MKLKIAPFQTWSGVNYYWQLKLDGKVLARSHAVLPTKEEAAEDARTVFALIRSGLPIEEE